MSGRTKGPPPVPEPLSVEVFDAHCHLDLACDRNDAMVDKVVADAQAVGIRRVVTTSDTLVAARWCAAQAQRHPDVYAAVAIHPNESHHATDEALAEIEDLARLPEVRAIGETGLDFYRGVDPSTQRESFARHIDIAKRVGKALVIHDRDAHDDVLDVLAAEGAPESTVFHCFSGDAEFARRCVDAGYVLSFAGTVTFTNAPALREAAKVAPLESILVETDAPFLTPHPYRGRPNAPYLIPVTIRSIAETKGVDPDSLCAAIASTGRRVFGAW